LWEIEGGIPGNQPLKKANGQLPLAGTRPLPRLAATGGPE
jgi:hypothetical protein